MANDIVSAELLRKGIREVALTLDSTVGITSGPKGLLVGINKPYGSTEITKDGYKVMKNIKPKDPLHASIASIFAQSCSQCNDKVGDGTTTSSILTNNMVMEALKPISAGSNRISIKNGMMIARNVVLKEIESMSRRISSDKAEEVAQVATISANGDKNIGQSIADAVKRVGKEGVITVEEGKSSKELDVDFNLGMQLERGYASPYFVTSDKMTGEFDNPYLLITEKKLSAIHPLIPILEATAKVGRPLVIIAEDIEGEALTALVLNRLQNRLKVAAIKAPGFGDRRKDMLEDIAILTGAKYVIKDELGIELEKLTLENLGTARRVVITRDHTIISNENSESDAVTRRISQLYSQIESSTSDYDKEKLRERIAKLTGGVAVLKVGGATEVEAKERKDRVEDALHATRAAVAEGIVPGGGVALLYAAAALDKLKCDNDEEQIGINIIKKVLSAPIRRSIKNAGLESAVIIDHLLKQNDRELIYNVETMNYANAFTAGVIDPAKVVRIAFETAISVASGLITTESMIVDIPEANNNAAAPMGGGMGDF
uniref:60 kDa chaperonin n=1 Tax=Wolbachia endosymbiont of Radopholus similis TaxID=573418 RepID=C6F0X1_9RICK|nr:GroEL [Wolbachia endosymbiont of Radopholus similis]